VKTRQPWRGVKPSSSREIIIQYEDLHPFRFFQSRVVSQEIIRFMDGCSGKLDGIRGPQSVLRTKERRLFRYGVRNLAGQQTVRGKQDGLILVRRPVVAVPKRMDQDFQQGYGRGDTLKTDLPFTERFSSTNHAHG
jgi:hypothetical protein